MGLAEGAVVQQEIARDEVLRSGDVQMPPERLMDRLRKEQDARFRG
jgi:predicted homoserine dehydrogenase-like protein